MVHQETPAHRTRHTNRRQHKQQKSEHDQPQEPAPQHHRSIERSLVQSQPVLTAPQRLAGALEQPSGYFRLPGLQLRLLLSLKSTLPVETDFALEVLLAASAQEPDLVSLTRFPGFIDPLLDLVELYASPGPFEHQSLLPVRRRSLESATVLRNLLCIDANLSAISPGPTARLLITLLRAFESFHPDLDHEFLSLLLDMLHSLSSHNLIRLDQPLQPTNAENIHRLLLPQSSSSLQIPESVSDDQSLLSNWSTRLISGLDQLTQSFDRALVLGAYRALTSIGSLSSNQPLLSDLILNLPSSEASSSPAWSIAIDRALILLALPDVELLMSILDYLYMVTSIHSVARTICTHHRDIYPILKLLLTHLYHHCKTSNQSPESLTISEPKWYFQPAPPSETLRALVELESNSASNPTGTDSSVRAAPQTLTMSEVHQILLSEAQINDIINLTEPRRAQAWMSRAFEACPGAEVQQVTLWLAYKTQFEHFYGPNSKFGPNHPNQMIAPAEAIKLTSDVFPNALPSVTEQKNGEKKFVISGMRVRPKKQVSIWKCNWKECTKNPTDEQSGESGKEPMGVSAHAEQLYQHIIKTHITPRANKCYWLTCTYQANNRTELLYHIRTHIPCIPLSNKKSSNKKNYHIENKISLDDQARPLPFKTYVHQRWETPNSRIYSSENIHHQSEPMLGQPGGGAIGIGFVSLLVIRNLIQSVDDGLNDIVKSINQDDIDQNTLSTRIPPDSTVDPSAPRRSNSPNLVHHPVLDQAQLNLINLAKLVSGFPTQNPTQQLSKNDSENQDGDLVMHDDDKEEREEGNHVFGTGFIEKKLHEFIANDLHLHNLAFDLLKKISSLSSNLSLISKHF